MKNRLKKQISLLLAVVMTMSIIVISPVVFGDDLVAINSTNFTDDTFRNLISEYYDKNDDGFLSASERSATMVSISGRIDPEVEQIKTLKGIEFFTNLKILRCGSIGLDTLDTSQLTNLTSLSCQGNNLQTLNLVNNSNIEFVDCSDNALTSLRLPYSSTLKTLYCNNNYLTEINLLNSTGLDDFSCYQNELTSLNLSNSLYLTSINCSYNHLTSLDLSNTSLENVTEQQIGNQSIEATASLEYGKIIIPFSNKGLSNSNYVSSSLDNYDDESGFTGDSFVAYDVDEIKDGVSYECSTMIESSENMTVYITVLRNFYQVNFYTSDNLSERIDKSIVNSGEDATSPQITEAPQCKTFDSWSDDITNVTEDKNVYIVWKDSHSYVPTSIASDNDTITLTCKDCGASYTVSFISIVNSKTGDSNFDANIDVVNDGYINAKDYQKILKDLG